jgi:hypothetical protein
MTPPLTRGADRLSTLHQRMLDDGWSPAEIDAVESLMLRARLHDVYLAAGYSPDDLDALAGLN